MRTYRNAKMMAKTLRDELARRNTDVSHGACLDIVARQFGLQDWNVLAARLNQDEKVSHSVPLTQPKGWIVFGEQVQIYELGIDPTVRHRGGHPALIRCRYASDDPGYPSGGVGFATLMQSVAAETYRGRRVSLSAELRTHDVVDAATLWFRVDGPSKQVLAFDNMEDRPEGGRLSGTFDWTERRIVLDVPDAAESLHFGFYLRGAGKVWASGFDLHEADAAAPSTTQRRFPAKPTNLDFGDVDRPDTPN